VPIVSRGIERRLVRARMRPETLGRIGGLAKYLLDLEGPTMAQTGECTTV